jgi:NAD(P)H dehydrogenase (quinone)
MRVLVVYCHPVPDSFCAVVRDTVIAALKARGRELRLIDLYAENFDPVMRGDERRTYNDHSPVDPALAAHIDHLKWAQQIVFVYPTWWFGLPAMLKGWFDRVWATDVAFRMPARKTGQIKPLMTHIEKIAVVTTCGAPRWWSFIMGHPGRKTILRGIRSICAPRCRTLFVAHYLMDVSTPESRLAFLGKVKRKLDAFC